MSKQFTDADNIAYLRQQSAIINRVAVELDYNSQYADLLPVTTSGNPFAPSVVFVSSDKVGRADWISGNADDVPMADLDMSEKVKTVHTAAIGYGYGWQELGAAQSMGINLTADKATAARRAYEEFVDVIAFNGDSKKGIKGFTNLSSGDFTAKTDNTAGNWSDAQKFLGLIFKSIVDTGQGQKPTADTVLVSPAKFALLADLN